MRLQGFGRLTPAVLLFATASLAVFRAPTHFLWMLAIVVTEWGQFFAIVCFALALPLWSRSWSGRLAACLCLAAAVVALTPVLRAEWMTEDLDQRLVQAFGEPTANARRPLQLSQLFLPFSSSGVQPKSILYRQIDGVNLSLDFYPSKNVTDAPLVVVIHGGSWNSGDNKDFVSMDQYLAGRGYAVADVLYRLAPRAPFPAASDDVRDAILFLQERASRLGFDPTRIVLLGRSAGGEIAFHVAYSSSEPSVRGIIAFYPPTDLFYGWEHPSSPWVIDTREKLTDYLGGSPLDFPERYVAASPVRQATAASPPVLLFHGGRDELVGPYHSTVMAHRLTELGVRNLNVSLPWATHGFDYFLNGPGGQISRYAIDVFLDSVCNRTSP